MARVASRVLALLAAFALALVLMATVVPKLVAGATTGAIKTVGPAPTLTDTAPAPPSALAASWSCPRPGAGWEVHITWSPSPTPGVSGYQLEWAVSPRGPWKPAFRGGAGMSQVGVPAGQWRWYQVRALKTNTAYLVVSSKPLLESTTAPPGSC